MDRLRLRADCFTGQPDLAGVALAGATVGRHVKLQAPPKFEAHPSWPSFMSPESKCHFILVAYRATRATGHYRHPTGPGGPRNRMERQAQSSNLTVRLYCPPCSAVWFIPAAFSCLAPAFDFRFLLSVLGSWVPISAFCFQFSTFPTMSQK